MSKCAAGQGLEPQYHAPEACVLPLDEPAILLCELLLENSVCIIRIFGIFSTPKEKNKKAR